MDLLEHALREAGDEAWRRGADRSADVNACFGGEAMGAMREAIELAATGVEVLAVAIIVFFVIVGSLRWLVHFSRHASDAFSQYRSMLGRALLIGLELLVAADIIRTVALETTGANVAKLAALVAIRTFLGWSLTVEIEGRWPWQRRAGTGTTANV
jgi:uncharacterized membrane protein